MARIRDGERNGAAIAQPQAPIPAVRIRLRGQSWRRKTKSRQAAASTTITGPNALARAAKPMDSCRTRVIDRPPGFDGAGQKENHQRQKGQGGQVWCVVPNGDHVEAARVQDLAEHEAPVRHQHLGHGGQRIEPARRESCTRQRASAARP